MAAFSAAGYGLGRAAPASDQRADEMKETCMRVLKIEDSTYIELPEDRGECFGL